MIRCFGTTPIGHALFSVLPLLTSFMPANAITPEQLQPETSGEILSGSQTPHQVDLCRNKLIFDGACRDVEFFRRFVSEGALLQVVYGSRSYGVDPGVVVVQSFADTVEALTILPEHSRIQSSATHGLHGYEIELIHTVSWFSDGGRRYLLQRQQRSRPAGFRISWWHHRTDEPSGWTITSSDFCDENGECLALNYNEASGGSGFRLSCDAQAALVGASWGVTVGIVGSGWSGNIGLLAGLGVSAIAGPQSGIPVGAAIGGAGVELSVLIGTQVGSFAQQIVKDHCEEPAPGDIANVPAVSSILVPGTDRAGLPTTCPEGSERFSGEIVDCSIIIGSEAEYTDDGVVVVGRCKKAIVTNACVVFWD